MPTCTYTCIYTYIYIIIYVICFFFWNIAELLTQNVVRTNCLLAFAIVCVIFQPFPSAHELVVILLLSLHYFLCKCCKREKCKNYYFHAHILHAYICMYNIYALKYPYYSYALLCRLRVCLSIKLYLFFLIKQKLQKVHIHIPTYMYLKQ